MKGFLDFIKEQGVVGLAVGFVLGGAVSSVVSALVNDLINPILGLLLGRTSGLKEYTWNLGTAELLIGDFITVLIDFIVIALVVYYVFKGLGLDKDKKKSK